MSMLLALAGLGLVLMLFGRALYVNAFGRGFRLTPFGSFRMTSARTNGWPLFTVGRRRRF